MSKFNEWLRLQIILPIAEKVVGTNSTYWFRQIEQMNFWSQAQILKWQEKKLCAMIQHVYDHTIYYHRIMEERGLRPSDIQHISDLQKLPIITKEIVREHFDEIVPDNLSMFKYREDSSGGTTGVPLLYYCDENTWGYTTAAKVFYWRKYGYHYGDPFAAMGSASLFAKKPSLARRIYDRIRNEIPMNTVNLTDELCEKYIDIIKKKRIQFLYGYAASIYIFTRYVANHNIDLKQIKGVFCTSENLTDDYRKLIQDTYDCVVEDCYGSRDAGVSAYETKYHHYEVGYNAILEIINPIAENTGTLLSTNLLNYTFPLLRYQFGDEVELTPRVLENDYNGQIITRVLGRTSDVMRLENGHNMTATGFSMIMKEFDVRAFTFNKTGENEVTLKIEPVKGKYNNQQEDKIRRTIYMYIGDDAKLNIEHVDKFEAAPNGKRRYFMNDTTII